MAEEAAERADSPSETYSRLESRLREFMLLKAGWDGGGAEEIPIDACYAALGFLGCVKRRFPANEPTSV